MMTPVVVITESTSLSGVAGTPSRNCVWGARPVVTRATEIQAHAGVTDHLSRALIARPAAWNGIGGREYRSKEQARLRKQAERERDCRTGKHSKDCPPETCPRKLAKQAEQHANQERHPASRDAGSGRVGSGRDGPSSEQQRRTDVEGRHDDDVVFGSRWPDDSYGERGSP
jgi:hypothetical protein